MRRGGDNSEEIYKVIGYFSNFKRYMDEKYDKEYGKRGVLIFRNDYKAFTEKLESDTGDSIIAVSAGVCNDDLVCGRQFEKICRYILDMQDNTETAGDNI